MTTHQTRFDKANWTPRALEVFATAKALAVPGQIKRADLLLALESGVSVASGVFKRVGYLPSATLDRPAPEALVADGDLYREDFDPELQDCLPRDAHAEARNMGWQYLGTDSLLLLLARLGIAGLPYDRVHEAIVAEHRNG